MAVTTRQLVLGLIGFQVLDAAICAVPNGYVQEDLDRLEVPPAVRQAIAPLKAASAVGLAVGLRRPGLGRLTIAGLMAYFVCAIGAHARVRDPAWRWVAAVGMLGWVRAAGRAYRPE